MILEVFTVLVQVFRVTVRDVSSNLIASIHANNQLDALPLM